MKIEEFESSQITIIIVISIIAIFFCGLILSSQVYYTKQTNTFIAAGCDYTYVPGKSERVWTNCKCKG